MEFFGHWPAAYWGRVQTFERLLWSRKNARGNVTAAREMLESPSRALRTARSFGFLARLVAPKVRKESFGLKPSFSQSFIFCPAVETGRELKAAGSSGLAPP